MTPSVGIAHLYALRAHLDAVILAAAEAEAGLPVGTQVEAGSCPECKAPPEKIDDMRTMDGTQRYHCGVCQYIWEPIL